VANKIDLPAGKNHAKLLAKKLPNEHQPLHSISAATREGVRTLVQYIGMKLEEIKQQGEMGGDAAGL
jgi:GTPase involved in cell partitioning and DNA repair